MEQQQRGRGRARGRARGTDAPQGQTPRPGPPRGGGPQGGSQGYRAAGPAPAPVVQPPPAWGPRSQVQQQHQIRAPAPAAAPQQQFGRVAHRGGGDVQPGLISGEVVGRGNGNGDEVAAAGTRGGLRGRRQIREAVVRSRPPDKSKAGTHGTPVRLTSNYFKLVQRTDWGLYQYRVDFAPEEDRTPRKKYLFRTATRNVLSGYIFDGTVLYTSNRINPEPMELFVQPEGSETNYRITIRLVGDVTFGDYQFIQVFNIILRKCMGHLNLQLVGRDFYDALAKITIPEYKLELWPGYMTSIRQHENSIMLCCEIGHKVMRNDTVLHLLTECVQEDRSRFTETFKKRIMGAIVLTDYNNRTYKIDDVDFKTTPQSTFSRKDGTSISYIQYYRERYRLNISSTDQPMLVSRAKQREIRAGMAEMVYLVPELCRMTGLTDGQRDNFTLMRELANHTRVEPAPRIEKLLKFSERLRNQPEIVAELRQWDLTIANSLVEFEGRVLPQETIVSSENSKYETGKFFDWTREVRERPMLHMAPITVWVVICPSRAKASAQTFVQNLQKAAKGMSWQLPFPKLHEIRDDRPATYLEGLETVINNIKPSLIMCVVSNKSGDRYSAIKKKCCVDRAIPTQVVQAKSLTSKNSMSIATKVAVQMNCKLGGAPWSVLMPLSGLMVVGYDVCHDANHKSKSYGAMVASLERQCTRYYSAVDAHTNGEEMSNNLSVMVKNACIKYQEQNGKLPDRILIYRDGVGDGQLPYIFDHEVGYIKKALADLYPNNSLKMCFIVVSKRINTRIFQDRRNPQPGTVVDSCITLPERYDFFIVSQCIRQGTVAPTSYNVLDDNLGLSPDQLQRITYKLTHLYYNWSGTVRVPAPCQYAHKLAFLVGQSLQRTPHRELEKVLYFL